ncbi:MAG: hypothetical protein Q9195_009523 [Heterodermia aff. obscurata]
MVVVIDAHTEPVNPPDASPVLTHDQLWGGALFELRNKALFFPSIESSEVISETEEEIVIRSMMKDHTTTGHTAGEHVTTFALSAPNKTDGVDDVYPNFHIIGIISQGSGGDTDLYYTVIYEWNEKEIEKGSAQHEELKTGNIHPSGQAKDTIDHTRRLVKNGEL